MSCRGKKIQGQSERVQILQQRARGVQARTEESKDSRAVPVLGSGILGQQKITHGIAVNVPFKIGLAASRVNIGQVPVYHFA